MDILISSNLERLLYHISGDDDALVSDLMNKLSSNGEYKVSDKLINDIKELFAAGYCDEKSVFATIKEQFDDYGYLCDTHTAVAVSVYLDYVKNTNDDIPTVIDSTASPYKFSASVLDAVTGEKSTLDEFDIVDELSKVTKTSVPKPLQALKEKNVRFTQVCSKENMSDMVFTLLNL